MSSPKDIEIKLYGSLRSYYGAYQMGIDKWLGQVMDRFGGKYKSTRALLDESPIGLEFLEALMEALDEGR
jgi:hypothetical protein